MKTLWKEVWAVVLMGVLLPGIILNLSLVLLEGNARELPILESVPETCAVETVKLPVAVRFSDNRIEQLDMDGYLTGVVLGEMPADFEPEAIKAQAVAARTYTAKAMETGGKHGDGSLCTNPGCCQAYVSEADYLSRGGREEGLEKVRAAVRDTSGWVLTYEGELIEATYFSCSGGSTEDAAAVWGTDYPYLRALESPGEENAAHYSDRFCFTSAQFQEKMGCLLTGDPDSWFANGDYTPGGGIKAMAICGETYTGTQLRRMLGLPSTAMTITVEGDTIIVVTKGYGHRVGMSQYGADAMAATGKTYAQILSYYYPGTQLEMLTDTRF